MKETVQSSVVWLDDIYAIYLSLRKKLSLHDIKKKLRVYRGVRAPIVYFCQVAIALQP